MKNEKKYIYFTSGSLFLSLIGFAMSVVVILIVFFARGFEIEDLRDSLELLGVIFLFFLILAIIMAFIARKKLKAIINQQNKEFKIILAGYLFGILSIISSVIILQEEIILFVGFLPGVILLFWGIMRKLKFGKEKVSKIVIILGVLFFILALFFCAYLIIILSSLA